MKMLMIIKTLKDQSNYRVRYRENLVKIVSKISLRRVVRMIQISF